MEIEMLSQLDQRSLALHGSTGHVRFESRRMFLVWSLANGFCCSAAILHSVEANSAQRIVIISSQLCSRT